MVVGICTHETLKKHGKDRHGRQRWKCAHCGATLTNDSHERPLGDMRIELDDAVRVLSMLLEGMSIRACERLTGICNKTICDLVLHVGEKCQAFLETTVRGVESKFIELDEIWGFVGAKDKTARFKNMTADMGDAWTWFAIDADSKLILAHVTGKRDDVSCDLFLKRVNAATTGRVQVTSDGLANYTYGVPQAFGSRCDFAQLIKSYKSNQAETRYSPATIDSIEKKPRFGNPDESRISTSYSERFNLSVRMHCRRLTRLTNAYSKTAQHHAAMISIFTAFYNFCRKHETASATRREDTRKSLKPSERVTPAMAAGLTDHVWTIRELLEAAK